jgi:hypothetical protein
VVERGSVVVAGNVVVVDGSVVVADVVVGVATLVDGDEVVVESAVSPGLHATARVTRPMRVRFTVSNLYRRQDHFRIDPDGSDQAGQEMDGETDDRERAAGHRGDEQSTPALKCVGPGLVHRFSGIDIGLDLVIGHRQHLDLSHIHRRSDLLTPSHRDPREHVVLLSLETKQHRPRFGGMSRLPEDQSGGDDGGIGGNDHVLRPTDSLRLFSGEAFHIYAGRFVRSPGLVEIGRQHFESKSETGQQFGATWRA